MTLSIEPYPIPDTAAEFVATYESRVYCELKRRLHLYRECDKDPRFRQLAWDICAEDPVFFMDNFVWTEDTRLNRVKVSEIPWQTFDHQREFIATFTGIGEAKHRMTTGDLHPMVVVKSRDQGVSVMTAALCVWGVIFSDRTTHYGLMTQSGKELDNDTFHGLFGKVDFILENLPWWMKPNLKRRSLPPRLINEETRSSIMGFATTTDKLRGPRFTRFVCDEANFIHAMRSIMDGMGATSPAPVLVSSVRGRNTEFAKIALGKDDHQTVALGSVEVEDDGKWRRLDLSYKRDPRKDETWEAVTQRGMTKSRFAQEYGMDMDVAVPGRIFYLWNPAEMIYAPGFEWAKIDAEVISLPGTRIIESWDFGTGLSLTTVMWAAYVEAYDTLVILGGMSFSRCTVPEVAAAIGAAGWRTRLNPKGRLPDIRIGDGSGANKDSLQSSWFDNLATEGIDLIARYIWKPARTIEAALVAMQNDKIRASPAVNDRNNPELPSVSDCLTLYKWDVRNNHDTVTTYVESGSGIKPRKDVYSHMSDSFLYIVQEFWLPDDITNA